MSGSPRTAIELGQEYLSALQAKGARPKTIQAYAAGLKAFGRFTSERGIRTVQEVTTDDLAAYQLDLGQRGLAPASQDLYLRTVRGFFRWLEASHRIFASPAVDLSWRPKPARLQSVPSETEIERLLAQPDPQTLVGLRDRAFLEFAYSTAARREELIKLNVHDVDLDHATVRIDGKGGSERVVPVGRMASAWLNRYLMEARPRLLNGSSEAALWIDSRGNRLGYFALGQVLRRYVRVAGLQAGLTLHSLRRACGTHMLQRGAHPAQLQALLGHASLKTLNRYLRLAITDVTAAHARSLPGQ